MAAETTRDFFGRIEKKELGDVDGKLDLRDDGILIHPGRTKPTAISFRLSGEYDLLRLRLSIPDLGTDGNAVADAGNVNVQIAIDGKTVLREHIERDSSLDREVPAKLGRELTVTVDNANGKPWWDWFFLSFLSTQRANAR